MADLLGVDRSTYSYYELGRIKPDIKTIMKLSEIFRVHYTKILESEMNYRFADISNFDDFDSNTKKFMKDLTQEEYSALMAFKILPEDSKNEIIEFINKKIDNFKDSKSKGRFNNYFK